MFVSVLMQNHLKKKGFHFHESYLPPYCKLALPVLMPEEERKLTFKAPQRSVKIKISVKFYFNTTFLNTPGE